MTALWGVDDPPPYDPDDIDHPDNQHAALLQRRAKDGAQFILDAPEEIPAIWGSGQDVLWARGESLIIVGPPGVGKTTLASQVIRARLGIGGPVLGQPIEKGAKRVLYLAMDRPAQIARALRRSFNEHDRATLREQLIVWTGPPPTDFAKNPTELVGLAQTFDADTVIIDSLKDAFLGMSNDEEAAGYNRARQYALAEGVELVELHHQVKKGTGGTKPNTLADVYGSAWITAGAGSVILLFGEAGDPIVDMRHLKQPAAEVGPYRVIHDHLTGTTEIFHAADLLQLATAARALGLSARAAASAMFTTDRPTDPQIEKARRRLEQMTREGHLIRVPGEVNGKAGSVYLRAAHGDQTMTNQHPTAPHEMTPDPTFRAQQAPHATVGSDTTPRTPRPPHEKDKAAGQDPTAHPTHPTRQAPHDSTPPFRGVEEEPDPAPAAALHLDQLLGPPCPLCNARAGHTNTCPNQTPKEPDTW